MKHDDRELEFVIVKRAINRFLFGKPFTVQYSCEQMAKDIIGMLEEKNYLDTSGQGQYLVDSYDVLDKIPEEYRTNKVVMEAVKKYHAK